MVRNGHQVTVIAPPPHYERKITFSHWKDSQGWRSHTAAEIGPSGERIIRSGFFPAGTSLTQRIFNQAFVALSMIALHVVPGKRARELRPDLVIGTVPALPTSVIAALVARLHGAPYALDLRDAWPDLLRESRSWNEGVGKRTLREKLLSVGPLQLLSGATEKSMNLSLKKASGVIVTSQREADHLSREFMQLPEGRRPVLRVIRNVFPPKSDSQRTVVRSNSPSLRVLYAGTLGRAQKLENALVAARIARDAGIDLELRLIGDGAAWYALHEKAEELGLDVEFHHRLPADELREYYDWADTGLVHLTDWEALERAIPSKTYELMELGVHISGVVTGEARDLIKELGAGHVVEPENPYELAKLWSELSKHPELLSVSDAGRKWVQRQRDEEVPKNLLELIAEIERRNS
nr:glycosyltransferase family 4 protein [Corynebacterium sp. NML120713]